MFASGRFHGAMELGEPGCGQNHCIPAFITTPGPATNFAPNASPTVCVHETNMPSRSAAVTCTVPLRAPSERTIGPGGHSRALCGQGSCNSGSSR